MAKIILFNKPFNVLCQFTDSNGRPTLADYINDRSVYAAGRLDYDSEGLVVLTDDGKLQHQISDPVTKMNKTYWVQVEGSPSLADLAPLQAGITLRDGPCRPAVARIISTPDLWPRVPPVRFRDRIPTSWLEIIISEGRNRQVRRMTAAVGFPTLRLVRVQVGPWALHGIALGEQQTLSVHSPSSRPAPAGPRRAKRSASPRTRL